MKALPFTISQRHLADAAIVPASASKPVHVRHRWVTQKLYCMAYAPILVGTPEGEKSGFCGLYYCGAKSVWQYPLRVQHFIDTAVGRRSHGVASALLEAHIRFGIPPSAWRLFSIPRHAGAPGAFLSERTQLAQIVGQFRLTARRDGIVTPLMRRISKVNPHPNEIFVPIESSRAEHHEFVRCFKLQRP